MLRKLHLQMTAFCTLFTGGILLALSLLCLLAASHSVRETSYASFSKELSLLLTNLQGQSWLSHQWLGQMQEEHHLNIYLYNNGEPLYYELLHPHGEDISLSRQALEYARECLGLDIFQESKGQRILHEEFPLQDCYASVGYLELNGGRLGFVVLYPLETQLRQLSLLRLSILAADLIALALLGLFAWFFTGHLLRPIAISREKQAHFIASASHELRSPLNVMLSGLESMEKSDTASDRHHFASIILQEGQRMKGLISDMLLLASSDSHSLAIHRTALQPDELLLSCFESYEGLAARQNIRLLLALPQEPLPDCLWDGDCIRQVLSILLDNALSYTPEGGRVRISLAPSGRGRLLLGVADTGPGIPPKEREQIFARFYRSDQARVDKSHFGLGLATARELVAAHQGRIWAAEDPTGEYSGAVFYVELPFKQSKTPLQATGH